MNEAKVREKIHSVMSATGARPACFSHLEELVAGVMEAISADSETVVGRMSHDDPMKSRLEVSMGGIAGSLDVLGGLLTKTTHGQEVEITFRQKQ